MYVALLENEYVGIKTWSLYRREDRSEPVGAMVWNESWEVPYAVYAYGPLGREFGICAKGIADGRDEALEVASKLLSEVPPLTKEVVAEAKARLKEERLRKEMSDDFAYTNGSIAAIDARMRYLDRVESGL